MKKMNEALFFDTETLSLSPYEDKARIILAQFGKYIDGEFSYKVYKEWEIDEVTLIRNIFIEISHQSKYSPMFTYNGLFDILYLIGRMYMLKFKVDEIFDTISLFSNHIRHCDMMQYDNGYLVSLNKLCNFYGIDADCKYSGKDISTLYENKQYDEITAHGVDDIKRLYRIVTETNLAYRFLNKPLGG